MKKKKAAPARELVRIDPLQRYLQEVHAYPMLSAEEEVSLAKRFHEDGDVDAARKLVTTHLRLVAKIAMEYRVAYHNLLDMIQEGNIGLLKAVQQFDPTKGARLSTYAQWWIRSYILKFILDNFRLIKVGTTKNQKKLFFNLMHEKEKIEAMGYYASPERLSKQLDVPAAQIVEMQKRLTTPEYSLDAPVGHSEGGKEALLADFLAVDERPVDEVLADQESHDILKDKFAEFSHTLSERDRKIFTERLLAELPQTLQEIADEYGITKERVRQLEERLIEKLKIFLQESNIEITDLMNPPGEGSRRSG
ncbi:MAG: RNA polymerase factor sigma-32 [Deltaproteobacteria bacterium]|nr:RNA polymerase factor sigma-32 [Deltaproteobacteria bacterium]